MSTKKDEKRTQPKVKTAFCESEKITLRCPQVGEEGYQGAQQQFSKDCDVNEIMRKYAVTGELPQPNVAPVYGDFSELGQYYETWNKIASANSAFHGLPKDIRRRFNNDPRELIQFMDNPDNRQAAESLGLINKTDTADAKSKVSVSTNRSSEKSADPATAGSVNKENN